MKNKKFSSDNEFLPSVLEVLETPPSPVKVQLLYTICLLVVVTFIWSLIGRIDVIAVASGKIQPQGNVKVVESMLPGKVTSIMVQNGDLVQEGEELVRFDPTQSEARYEDYVVSMASLRAEISRRQTENMLVKSIELNSQALLSDDADIIWPELMSLTDDIKKREMAVMRGELTKLNADLEDIRAQLAQNAAREQSSRLTLSSQQALISTLNQRLELRRSLLEKQLVSKDDWLQVMSSVKEAQSTLVNAQAQLVDTVASKAILLASFAKTREAFLSSNMQKISDAERQVSSLEQKLRESRVQLDLMTLRSPVSGTVVASNLTTRGQVVEQGEEVMRIVPKGTQLEVVAYLPNQDIGFVHEGQSVDIKVNAFPFTRYGVLNGVVKRVSKDAITEADAQKTQLDPTRGAQKPQVGGGQATQNLVFPIVVELTQNYINIDGRKVNLVTGMGVSAEIKTDRRRLIEYLVSPVYGLINGSLHER
ncbi:HlyD family type I secretion periplasmic adaptor subunit [Citrobacter portucalensis]|uniref:HlyD family type I secretion periplasmic adaptor subunit n=1 Tax=Citrobacter portucalensis TaxID=1639133 RepID=UPI00226B1A16|nr:HlyD family type I secretion periplasmic adaptor subunit [Citrobacter portucalensis]MCX8980958.1 HlyD family type I secretion periplasmic adaptor subunit [Citrobacter portucalensis]